MWALPLLAALVLLYRDGDDGPGPGGTRRGAPVEDRGGGEANGAAPPQRDAPAGGDAAASGAARRAPDAATALGAPEPAAAWRAQVRAAIRPLATAYLGRPPSAAEEERLVDALGAVRAATRPPREPATEPAAAADERERTLALARADRTFRDIVGVGVAEFIRELEPTQVEDLAPSTR